MTQETSTEEKCVGFRDFTRYHFYGYTFDLPSDVQLYGIKIYENEYIADTDKCEFRLKACQKCKSLMTENHFYYGTSPCKRCHILLVEKWRKLNPDLVKRYKKKSYQNIRNRMKNL